MSQVGRISGPLLFANLERNGIDLAFRNTLDDTQLLYLDVNNGLIGVNKSSPGYQVDVAGTTHTTDLIANTSATIADLSIDTSNINNLTGNINLNAQTLINLSNFETDNIHISDNVISSYRSNSSIELNTNGTGTVEIPTNLNVYGNLHATGNITLDGTITFGDSLSQDNLIFGAEIDSDIIPDLNNTYTLGSTTKRWNELYTKYVNGQSVSTGELVSGLIDFNLRHGNIFYVAQNGNDSNVGDSPLGPFKTIKRALDAADASSGAPVIIYVYPGGYEEECPLVVPANTSIVGLDLRNTIIRPDSAYQSEDIFHLNGETTVQNVTITDFYYDSGNNTGYAFRFAPSTVVTTRSPYIQNVTVITKGTTTSASDPRGFASGDAGKGALIDGASVLSSSQEASMLFHSSTFITPGVDAITMTNGVRVEWLNSFTYFANRGLYAVDGVTGHLSTDGSTVKYGAELRSIGSANVYGNYGAVADGADCLMYLIQHNMAYIGAGKYSDNDPSRVIQSQEVSELNSGKIYYQTIDHLGNFRVGDNFYINQESGETSLVLTEAQIDALNGLTITTNGSTTYITGEKVETGNIRFKENTVSSLIGPINFSSAGSDINLLTDTYISKNLTLTGDLTFDGSLITVGNETTDTIAFNTEITQNIYPDITGTYKLGSTSKTWKNIWLSKAEINDIEIFDNVIRSTASNADLELRANGSGLVIVPNNNVTVSERLINTLGTTTLSSASMTVLINNGDTQVAGNYSTNDLISETLDVTQAAQFEEILIDDNVITTTSSNADLELYANGTGEIIVPDSDVEINNNLTVTDLTTDTINVQSSISSVKLVASNNITVRDNYITTTQSNSDLELYANGIGKIFSPSPVQIDNNLTVNNNLTFVGNLSGDDILNVTNINAAKTFNAEKFKTDAIEIWDNNISTVVSNADLDLRANGSGTVYFESIGLNQSNLKTNTSNLSLSPGGNLNITSSSAMLLPKGTNAQRINNQGNLRFNTQDNTFEGYSSAVIGFGGVFSADRQTSVTTDPYSNNIRMIIGGAVNPLDSTDLVGEVTGSGLTIHGIQVDDISIQNNIITTNVSNSDLVLERNGTGQVILNDISIVDNTIKNNRTDQGALTFTNTANGYSKITGTFGVVIPTGNNTTERGSNPQVGETRYNETDGYVEVYDGTQWIIATGGGVTVNNEYMEDLSNEWTLILG